MHNLPGRVGDVGSYLREQREHAKLSVRQLAALAGVSNPYLSQIERGLRKPSAEVLQQLARGLRISAEALYLRAGILDAETLDGAGDLDVHLAVHADARLTERQKRVLLELYATFLEENGHSGSDVAARNPGRTSTAADDAADAPSGEDGAPAVRRVRVVAPSVAGSKVVRPLRTVPRDTASLPEPPA